jgi:hypothetical protein
MRCPVGAVADPPAPWTNGDCMGMGVAPGFVLRANGSIDTWNTASAALRASAMKGRSSPP